MRVAGKLTHLELTISDRDLPRSKRGGVLPRKNTYFKIGRHGGRPGLYRTQHAVDFTTALACVAARAGIRCSPAGPPIRAGWWALDLLVLAPGRLRTLDVLLPRCDSDACLAPVKDALIYAYIIDDDARIVSDRTWVAYRQLRPEIRIRLTQIDAPDREIERVWPGVCYFGARPKPLPVRI